MSEKFDYIEEAHVTLSDKFHGELVSFATFANVLSEAIVALNKLDDIKKALFYGRRSDATTNPIKSESMLPVDLKGNDKIEFQKSVNVIHAIMGKSTESGELLEALFESVVEGEDVDSVNLIEEIGDGFWYDAILLKALNSDFETAQRINIAKLRKRFANKFTEFDANNRNLNEERTELEKSTEEINKVVDNDKQST